MFLKIQEQAYWIAIEKKLRAYQAFVFQNPGSFVSITALDAYVNGVKDNGRLQIALGMYKSLDKTLQVSPIGLAIKEKIEDKLYPMVGKSIVSLELEGTTGAKKDIANYKGKILLIDFWASWCSPCRKEAPELITLYNKYKDQDVAFIGISIDENKAQWIKAIRDLQLPWPQFIDETEGIENSYAGKAGRMFRVQSVPSKFLVSAAGTIVAKDLTISQFDQKIQQLVGATK